MAIISERTIVASHVRSIPFLKRSQSTNMIKLKRFTHLAATAALLAGCAGSGLLPAQAQVSGGKMPTRWDKDVSPKNPLPEYPRPQMQRAAWQSLNGPWDLALSGANATTAPDAYDSKILVPYPYESALSGIGKPSIPDHARGIAVRSRSLRPGRGSASCYTSAQ